LTTGAVAIVGLGVMGLAMAQTLRRAGWRVAGADPSAERRQLAEAAGVAVHVRAADAVAAGAPALLSLPTAREVEAVVASLRPALAAGALIVDTTTSHPAVTRRLAAELAADGVAFVDAPVSGGRAGAEAGRLTIVVGGAPADRAAARPLLDTLAATVIEVGASGAGHAAKLVNNWLCAAHLLTTAEAVKLGRSAGLDPADLLRAIAAGSGRSGVAEANFPRWVLNGDYDSGFTMGLMRKDVALAADLAASVGVEVALLGKVAETWATSVADLADGEDFNRIAGRLAGLTDAG
jgi:3-hydroxyisobutyrate dehydrogenase